MAGVQNFFTDGAVYERLMGRWSVLAGKMFLNWLAAPKGGVWLDVGCGTGAFTGLVVERESPSEIHGIDPSSDQLAFAKARAGLAAAKLQTGSAVSLPYKESEFDIAVMALVISFVPDPAKAVSEMVRVVRPEGWVATYMWDIQGGGFPYDSLHRAMEVMGFNYPKPPGAESSRLSALEALWKRADLENVETRVITLPTRYENFEDYWNTATLPVGPSGQFIQKLGAQDISRLKDAVRQLLPEGPNGEIVFNAVANAVKGRVS
jgi:ubiquinone/menaquinone biosynthesis C-methylase UbiE